jgi:alanyl-tRNA synthetase
MTIHAIIVMMKAKQIIDTYISFFEKNEHKHIANASLVPLNDPSTLFTSSGMQPLVPYLLGETHPAGKRLVNVQNCFRAQDIDEIGDNRHTTLFRMLGNWSLGDYFKKEQIPWFFHFLTKELHLDPKKLYITVYAGEDTQKVHDRKKNLTHLLALDTEAIKIWQDLFKTVAINAKFLDMKDFPKNVNSDEINQSRIFSYGSRKNWWSRSGTPDIMPIGEPGGPDTEVFYDFGTELQMHENSPFKDELCHPNCDCGRFIEIGNSVFMQYKKISEALFEPLPNQNVDFGGGLERILMAVENQPDVFKTSLMSPIITALTDELKKTYEAHARDLRIVAAHLTSACFITNAGVKPSNTEQGYILRRLIRRAMDSFYQLEGKQLEPILEAIVEQYKDTDPDLVTNYETIKDTIIQESQTYHGTRERAKKFIEKKYKQVGDELKGVKEISAEDAFVVYTTHGLSPTQIESLGYTFDRQAFAEKMEAHQKLSKQGAEKKFRGGLADHQERTIMGHTATHLLHQALRDILGDQVHQTGSNITTERLRFDFNHDQKLTDEQIKQVEAIVTEKIKENLPVHFEMLPLRTAKELGAIGLFDEKYEDKVKVYFIGGSGKEGDHQAYSKEFCGGPHVEFTGKLKSFKIIKQENIGNKQRRLYAVVD